MQAALTVVALGTACAAEPSGPARSAAAAVRGGTSTSTSRVHLCFACSSSSWRPRQRTTPGASPLSSKPARSPYHRPAAGKGSVSNGGAGIGSSSYSGLEEVHPNDLYAGISPEGMPGYTTKGATDYARLMYMSLFVYSRSHSMVPWKPLFFIGLWTMALCAGQTWSPTGHLFSQSLENGIAVFQQLLAPSLGLLLVFRVNQAYTRWWECRNAIGQVLNRLTLLAQIAVIGTPSASAFRVASLLKATAIALVRECARTSHPSYREEADARMRVLLTHDQDFLRIKTCRHKVDALLLLIRQALDSALAKDSQQVRPSTQAIGDIHGYVTMCRSALTTPMPESYAIQMRVLLCAFLATVPIRLIAVTGPLWTFCLTLITAYSLLGLDAVSSSIVNPFGDDPDDLPMQQYSEEAIVRIDEIVSLSEAVWEEQQVAL